MGELKVKLPDEVERAFRIAAMKRFGYQKGSMSEAATEAIKEWANVEYIQDKDNQSFDDLVGVLKHVKKSSVELQHETLDYIANKYSQRLKKRK
ncbi:MAG TPA: hypothetical protein VJK03_05510 [Candidatus Nanoarchaeia archaeon]|nr:hypothetical protein [Candidatus Nanoarchaeia archaeon]